jgi:2-keto-4-pentenoate hydratase/2-oxohepta-3-ene-1,7-dioic acid hydratase in catechol pathway
MTQWIRFRRNGEEGFGMLDNGMIHVHTGNMFDNPVAAEERVALDSVEVMTPTQASKMVCLWNNFRALAEKLEQAIPPEPLYFIKAPNAYLAHDQVIRKPVSYDGRVVYEGELGIIIGRTCSNVEADEAGDCIFGYTCINDVTALEILNRDPSFAQWTRAKSFDTFGVFGPVVATGLNPAELSVVTVLNGKERQNYPCSDMVFSPAEIVSRISKDMTLSPGDVIACGTSLGVGPMRAGQTVEVTINGVGTLRNRFE